MPAVKGLKHSLRWNGLRENKAHVACDFFFHNCIHDLCTLQFLSLEQARSRACLHGGRGPQVGEVTRLSI